MKRGWLAVAGWFSFLSVFGQDRGDDNLEEVRSAVKRGLAYLAENQQENGAWRCLIYAKGSEGLGKQNDHVGATALACLAFMADGNYPDRGKYAHIVSKGLEYILSSQAESGYISGNGTRMYEHAFATLFLAELLGNAGNKNGEIRRSLERSVRLLSECQSQDGGWRYQPAPISSDLSVTVTVVQALRAARNKGLAVPKETIERALKYADDCESIRSGGFRYQLGGDRRITYNLTAAGVVALFNLGASKPSDERWDKHFQYMESSYTRIAKGFASNHYFYGNYYATQAFYQRGGREWTWYNNRAVAEIAHSQRTDGSWTDDVHPNYATAMACIILQIPREYLPIMQK